MINKPSIIVSSLGRTGTVFIAKYFQNFYPNISSFHEPGFLDTIGLDKKKMIENIKAIKKFGIKMTVLNKIIRTNDIRYISKKNFSTKDATDLSKKIISLRKNFIEHAKGKIYLESNYHYYGLFDILDDIFRDYRAVYIVRDPRDQVRSWMNRKSLYSRLDIHTWDNKRLLPRDVDDEIDMMDWKKFNRFQKISWMWKVVNSKLIQDTTKNNRQRIFLFEDLFLGRHKVENFIKMIDFVLSFENTDFKNPDFNLTKKFLKRKMNKSNNNYFPHWRNWTSAEAKELDAICGPLMQKFGYGQEKEWQDKIHSS